MDKNSSTVRRSDILSLDLKEIKRTLPSVLQTKLIVSKENKDSKPLSQSVIKPWILSPSDQVAVSRNKVAHELLHHCRNGFILDDPFIRETRFFVDYHRMHDPGLKRYYNSIPVRNRMKKLELVTNENDAICSQVEFVDYLRYLDSNLTRNINQTAKLQRERQLEQHFQRLKTQEKNVAQFTGILRRRKTRFGLIADTKAINKEEKRKLRKQIKMGEKAVDRMINIRNEKSQTCRLKNQEKQDKFWPRKKEMIRSEKEKRIGMGKILDCKIVEARERKESLQTQKQTEKMQEEIDYFKRHALFRQEALSKNIELYDIYQEQQRRNIEKRNRKIQKIRDNNDDKRLKKRNETLKEQRNTMIANMIMKNITKLKKRYMKRVDPYDLDEVNRRISLITQAYIVETIGNVCTNINCLGIDVSSVVLAAVSIRVMELRVIIDPEIGYTRCVLVRQKIAKIMANTIKHLIQERVKVLKEDHLRHQRQLRQKRREASDRAKKLKAESEKSDEAQKSKPKKKCVVRVDEDATVVIGESSYGEFVGTSLAPLKTDKFKTIFDLNGEIRRDLHRFLENITTNEFEYSEILDEREFAHLYDFQKYFLHKATRRFMELVNTKILHYWHEKEMIMSWKNLELKSKVVSNEAAEQVMNFPNNQLQFCAAIKKMSQYVCVKVHKKLEKEQIPDTHNDDSAGSSRDTEFYDSEREYN